MPIGCWKNKRSDEHILKQKLYAESKVKMETPCAQSCAAMQTLVNANNGCVYIVILGKVHVSQ
jgi:hypothetical protein